MGKGEGFRELLKKNQRIVCDGDCHPDLSHEVLYDTDRHRFILDVFKQSYTNSDLYNTLSVH